MATKIQLRRDLSGNWTSTNPILAQGEPGVELDTNRMKVGDGVTAWSELAYIISETTTENQFIRVNGLGGNYYTGYPESVSVSTDGLHWTQAVHNADNSYSCADNWVTCGFAVGGGHMVYGTYNSTADRTELRFADNAFQMPHLAKSDNTRLGPHGENLTCYTVRYAGENFVAAGYYYDSDLDNFDYPYAIYSTDADNWTIVNIDLDHVYGIIQAEIARNGGQDMHGLVIGDVASNGTGWLFGLHYTYDETPAARQSAGAYYVTDLTTTLTATNYISNIPGTYVTYFDGHGWMAWGNYVNDSAPYGPFYYFNSSTDPRQGSWRTVDMREIGLQLTGETVGFCNQSNNVAAGEIDGISYIVISAGYHGVFYTSDQGVTWNFSQPGPNYASVSSVTAANPAVISWSGSNPSNHERVVISGSNRSQLNGTWFYNNSNQGLYSDEALTTPLDASGWGGDTHVVVYTTGTYKSAILQLASTDGIVPGMIIQGYGPWVSMEDDNWVPDPNVVVSVNTETNQVTMTYPMTDGFHDSITFRALMTLTQGDGVENIVYGNGAFVGFSSNYGYRAYRTTDLQNWTHTSRAVNAQEESGVDSNYYQVSYGAVTTHNGLIRSDSRNLPGFTNHLAVGDTFSVVVSNGDDQAIYSGGYCCSYVPNGPNYGQGKISMDPLELSWEMGIATHCCCGGVQADTKIETYCGSSANWPDSVRISSWDHTWSFDNWDGALLTDKIKVGDQTVNDEDSYIEQFNFYEDTIYMTNDRDLYIGSFYCSGREQANCACCGSGSANLHYDCATWFYADSNGSHIDAYDRYWNFTNDYTGHSGQYSVCACGVMYIPESSNIQTYGYWRLGDADNNCSYTYVGATDWVGPCAYDIRISADCAQFHFTRDGDLVMPGCGYVQSPGYWRFGDAYGDGSYTYIGAVNNTGGCALDVLISANCAYFYFNQDGTFQLPEGGDIIDYNGYSLIASVPPLPQVGPVTGDHTLALSDRGKHIYYSGSGGNTIYVPTNSVAFPLGSQIVIVTGDHSCTLAVTDNLTTTMVLSGFGVDNSITVNANTYITLLKIDTEKWIVRS